MLSDQALAKKIKKNKSLIKKRNERIRELYKQGMGATDIAKLFDTNRTYIHEIVRGVEK